jgi:hypothetical protein
MISRGKERLRDIRPPQESLVCFQPTIKNPHSVSQSKSTLFSARGIAQERKSCQSSFVSRA